MNKEINYSFNLLKKIYFDEGYSSIELNKLINSKKHEKVNFGLITKIVYGVLEKDISVEYIVSKFVKKNPEPNIMLLLKMATYISRFTNSIPNYAVINECVEIAKKENKNVSGFVNATLKNIFNNKVLLPNKGEDLEGYLSIKYSYPVWIIKELLKSNPTKFVEEYLSKELTTLTHIRVVNTDFENTSCFDKDGKISSTFKKIVAKFENDMKQNNIEYKETPLPFTFYVDYAVLKNNPLFDGRYVVQGIPSILTSINVGVLQNDKVLDCTGAPGGKSVLMAELCPKSQITCCDIHDHRVELIKAYATKQKVTNITPLTQDATKFNKSFAENFDKVLCDVPCSGIGVVNKKPDILLNRTLNDVKTLSGVQYNILTNNAKYVKLGGTLVYSTCSIMEKENEEVVRRFLSQNKGFELQPIETFGISVRNNDNMYTFYPNISDTEGFFIAKLKRIK